MSAAPLTRPARAPRPSRLRSRLAGRWGLVAGLATILLVALSTALAPWIAPYPPDLTDYAQRFAAPSLAHPMGTDAHGRDVLSRILWGGRVSLAVSAVAVGLSSAIGIPLGLLVGYLGGVADAVAGRLTDALFAFPSILWAIGLVAVLGPSGTAATLALAVARLPVTVRVARGAVISAKSSEYVEASRALGSSTVFIVFRGILPNCLGPLVVLVSLGFAVTILAEAGLGYLGLSVQPPTPSWGSLIQESQRSLHDSVWLALFPGLTLMAAVLAINLVGDGVQDMFGQGHDAR